MKPCTVALSFLGFCIFYICNADWMDQLYETLIEDYEEVAPFVSSVTAGTDEFDQIIEELVKSKKRWYQSSSLLLYSMVIILTFTVLMYQIVFLSKERNLLKTGLTLLSYFFQSQSLNLCREIDRKIQNSPIEVTETQTENHTTEEKATSASTLTSAVVEEDVPLKLLWQGGSLVESSVHCDVRENSVESKILQMQKHLLQSKLMLKCATNLGGGDKSTTTTQLSTVSSDESIAAKMAEIRKLLESEQEMTRAFANGDDGMDQSGNDNKPASEIVSCRRTSCSTAGRLALTDGLTEEYLPGKWQDIESVMKISEPYSSNDYVSSRYLDIAEIESNKKSNHDWEHSPDLKLMNRIRLLENRLRLEELKNKNWINRMSRAEGILKQLNKQVERMEETRPMETRTETLKITSTVTNWASSSHPRRNTQFTLVNRYQPFYLGTPCLSLSEVIEKEIGLSSAERNQPLYPLAPKPPALLSPHIIPQPSFFSRFLSSNMLPERKENGRSLRLLI